MEEMGDNIAEKKKDPFSFVMTIRKAVTYIVDENGNEIEQPLIPFPPALPEHVRTQIGEEGKGDKEGKEDKTHADEIIRDADRSQN